VTKEKKLERVSLAFGSDIKTRLAECADRTKQKAHSLAQAAVEAAIEAIEANNYRIVTPIEFTISYIPQRNPALHPVAEDAPKTLEKPLLTEEKMAEIVERTRRAKAKPNYP